MSEEMAILPGRDTRVDSSQPQQQEITVDHPSHMSIDELVKMLKETNGTPVLLIPSADGQLSAIAINGLQNMVPTNHQVVKGSTEKKIQDFRAWLLLVASLAATVTFTAGLTPPGGFWADDEAGHVAGTPVMRDKFPWRYRAFQYSNSLTFFASLWTIGTLAKNILGDKPAAEDRNRAAELLADFSTYLILISLGTSYIAGTWDSLVVGIYNILYFVIVLSSMSEPLVVTWSICCGRATHGYKWLVRKMMLRKNQQEESLQVQGVCNLKK